MPKITIEVPKAITSNWKNLRADFLQPFNTFLERHGLGGISIMHEDMNEHDSLIEFAVDTPSTFPNYLLYVAFLHGGQAVVRDVHDREIYRGTWITTANGLASFFELCARYSTVPIDQLDRLRKVAKLLA